MRTRGYSLRTEKTYVYWIRFFIRYQKRRHPKEMEAAEVVQFPGFLANDRHVSVNTQKLALNALAFLYNTYLELPLGDPGFQHANKPAKLPVVILPQEVGRILAVMNNRDRLLFGSGLRISECLRLRIKDSRPRSE
jgi:integrase